MYNIVDRIEQLIYPALKSFLQPLVFFSMLENGLKRKLISWISEDIKVLYTLGEWESYYLKYLCAHVVYVELEYLNQRTAEN